MTGSWMDKVSLIILVLMIVINAMYLFGISQYRQWPVGKKASYWFNTFVLILLLGFTAGKYTEPNYYPWPKITICRGCNQTIYAWQSYDRRERPVQVNGNGKDYMVAVSMSSLFHSWCETAAPLPMEITVTNSTDEVKQ